MNFLIKRFTLHIQYWSLILFLQLTYAADDTESWNSIGFETKLPYSIKLELEQGLRLKDQLSSFKQTFTELSISYKIIDGMIIFIPIRYAIFQDKIKERISVGGSYRYNLKPISIKYRAKFQRMYEDSEFSSELVRNKFSMEYKINKKFKPYISGEIFHLYSLNQYQYDEYRVSFGLNVDLPRKKELKIFYIFKLEDITKTNPDQINAFGFAYNLKL